LFIMNYFLCLFLLCTCCFGVRASAGNNSVIVENTSPSVGGDMSGTAVSSQSLPNQDSTGQDLPVQDLPDPVMPAIAPQSSVSSSSGTAPAQAAGNIFANIANFKKIFLPSLYDPEKDSFSNMTTIESWIARKYWLDNILMKKVQGFVYENSFGNPDWITSFTEIKNNPGDNRFFGKTFPSMWGIELPFLQFVNQQSRGKSVKTLEVAAGAGFVSWKVPFAFEGDGLHLATDLSESMIYGPFKDTISKRLDGTDLKDKLQAKVCDIFDLLTKFPELEGTFDAIYVQNLEHFFNPIKHQEFLKIISRLLTNGGKAFLSSHSQFYKTPDTDAYNIHVSQNRKNDPYSGFISMNIEYPQVKETGMILKRTVTNVRRAEDNEETKLNTFQLTETDGTGALSFGKNITIIKTLQDVTMNYFSPLVYKNAVNLLGSEYKLKLDQSYLLDKNGTRIKNWCEDVLFACAIVSKKEA